MNIRFLALSSALTLLPLVGCNNPSSGGNTVTVEPGSSSASNAAAGSGGKELKLAFVTNNPSDYWTIARRGVEKADKELDNVTVDVKLPAQGTAAEQTQLVNDLLAKGVDGIAISPVDPANQTKFLDDTAGKALLFTQDSDAPKSKRVCYIGTDNVAAGKQAGDLLKKALPNGGKVMIFVGKADAQNAADRINGLKSAIAGSKVEVLAVRTDDTDRAKAQSNVSDAITKYPDLAACVGIWSYNGPAILNAVKASGKIGKVQIVAFDEEPDTLAGVKAGSIYATVVQQPYEFGYQSIINMEKYLGGDKSVVPANGQLIVPTKAITKADVDAFKANLEKLRAG
ncbi:ABC transporter substrate-binding protein [bacterium]|nr:MAG: ABC transporter substrate-binding protein [bacterium]